MKKFISCLIVLTIIVSMGGAAVSAAAPIKLKVNNQVVTIKGATPYRTANGVMVPLSEAAKAAGASVGYVKGTNEAKVTFGKTVFIYQTGRRAVLINGASFMMPQMAAGKDGRIYVLARFLYAKMGGKVGWDAKTNTVIVTIKKPAASATTTTPTSGGINVAMPASKDFKPYIAELTPIDAQDLKELQAYKDDKDGDLLYKRKGVGINYYMSNAEVIKKVGLDAVRERCVTMKSMMEVENNVDYRTIGSDFIQKYRYFFMPGGGYEWVVKGKTYGEEGYIKLRYDDIKKYKIIEQSEFLTDTSLVYGSKNCESRVRGRLKFMFESIDSQYFKDYSLPKYELNKWYTCDMEITNGILFSTGNDYYKWPHSYYSLMESGKHYLTNIILR